MFCVVLCVIVQCGVVFIFWKHAADCSDGTVSKYELQIIKMCCDFLVIILFGEGLSTRPENPAALTTDVLLSL